MKLGTITILEDKGEFKVILEKTGETVRVFTEKRKAEAYKRGWNSLEKA